MQRICVRWQDQGDCNGQPLDYLQGRDQFKTQPVNNFEVAMQQLGALDALQHSVHGNPPRVFSGFQQR